MSPGIFDHADFAYPGSHSRSLPSTPRLEEYDSASGNCFGTQLSGEPSAQVVSGHKLRRKSSKPAPLNISPILVNNESKGLDPLLSPTVKTRIGPQQGSSSAPVTFPQSAGWPLDRARSASYPMGHLDQGGNVPVELNVPESETSSSYRDDILEDYGVSTSPFPLPNSLPVEYLPPKTSSSSGFPSSPKSHNSGAQSLRSKLSISGMQNASNASPRRWPELVPPRVDDGDAEEEEVIEVDDMEFTLVRPTLIRHPPPPPEDEEGSRYQRSLSTTDREGFLAPQDSGVVDRDSAHSNSPSLSPLSPNSPLAMSPFHGSFPPSLMPSSSSTHVQDPPSNTTASPVSVKSAEMHRQLELKWLSVMNSIPSSEAKKSRRVRKLVMDGIPASVRGVVW